MERTTKKRAKMADYSSLKAAIRAAIYDNVTQAITGDKLQEILLEMVNELGVAYTPEDLEAMAETWTFTLFDGTSVTKKIIVLP